MEGAGALPPRPSEEIAIQPRPLIPAALLILWAALACPVPLLAQTVPQQITVIGVSPLPGGIDRALVPSATQVLTTADLTRTGAPDLLAALDQGIAGLTLDSASGNPYQPSLFYNGFEASPLQGTPQGIAVYLNFIRFNQPFGDTVNWDLIPAAAISRLTVEGADPVFGLNALGGAINVTLKDGFSAPGGEADLSGGSFGQITANTQYGVQDHDQAFYAAASVAHQQGWRDLQSSDIQNAYGDYALRRRGNEVHVNLAVANSSLNGPGTAPVELLAADPRAQFTAPNLVDNRFLQTSLRGSFPLADRLTLQTQAYYSYFLQKVRNGNVAADGPCDDGSGLLCQDDGTLSTTRGGAPIPDFRAGGPYNELDAQTTSTNAAGAAGQITATGPVFGRPNHLVAGADLDASRTEFSATAFLGGLTASRGYSGNPGVVIDEAGSTIPVRVAISRTDAGAYVADTFSLTGAIAFTASARFNVAETDLHDQQGGDLAGNHAYARINPAFGGTWKLLPFLAAYAGYAEANRAPTPAELSCAGPQNACSLANFFVGDPDLRQVVSHSIEAGLRGTARLDPATRLSYRAGLFRVQSDDDIVFINSVTLNRAFFANIGKTRRQGLTMQADLAHGPITATLAYTYTEASFQSAYVENAGSNPAAGPDGLVTVRPGARLPGIPDSILKASLDYALTPAITIGADAQLQSGQYLFGDEANLTPRLPGYFRLDFHATCQITPRLQLFAAIRNALDRRYETYGTFSPTALVFLAEAPDAANPRAYSPAAPIAASGGLRVTF